MPGDWASRARAITGRWESTSKRTANSGTVYLDGMSDLTYRGRRGPERQAARVASRRDQDAAVRRGGEDRGRLSAPAAAKGLEVGAAAFEADARCRAALSRVARAGR